MYPDWAIGLGWGLALSSMVCIPMVIVILFCRTEGPFRVVSMGHGLCGVEASQCQFLCDPLRVPGLLSLHKRREIQGRSMLWANRGRCHPMGEGFVGAFKVDHGLMRKAPNIV